MNICVFGEVGQLVDLVLIFAAVPGARDTQFILYHTVIIPTV